MKRALEGEGTQVTALFADLKGSMELLADRDPEETRKLLEPGLERTMKAVRRRRRGPRRLRPALVVRFHPSIRVVADPAVTRAVGAVVTPRCGRPDAPKEIHE
jgi:hypothetical protein